MTSPLRQLVCNFCSSNVFTFDAFQLALQIGVEDNEQGGLSYTSQHWKAIVDGEDQGCGWCRILKEKILEFNSLGRNVGKCQGTLADETTFQVKLRVQASQLKVKIDIIDSEHTYTIYCSPGDPAAIAGISGRNIVWNVGSDEAFKLASASILECVNFHPSCPRVGVSELPTRVIDCADPQRPMLVTTTKGQRGSYVALSYVWGEPQPYSTTTKNVDAYQQGIDIKLLPETIQDAVVCTHKLNLRYLWADTLCILQDSGEDKNREIARMHYIYRDAYIAIIAASAPKVSRGFLEDRSNPMDDDDRLPFWCPDGRLGTISVFDDWVYTPFVDPVNERAWCFQERTMSPRALIYATDSLQYQCATHLINVGGSPICKPSDHRIPRLPAVTRSPTPLEALPEKDARVLHEAWEDILSKYTQRALTDRSDKLPAISAIAQIFAMHWGSGRYIAGLWERNLSSDLLWYRSPPARRTQGRNTAPSWSWAATDGQVQMGGYMEIRSTVWEIRLCEAIPVIDGFPFGQVKEGKLEVQGIVRKVVWDNESLELFERRPKEPAARPEGQVNEGSTVRRMYTTSINTDGPRTAAHGDVKGAASTSCSKRGVQKLSFMKMVRTIVPCVTAKHYALPAEVTPNANADSAMRPIAPRDEESGQLASIHNHETQVCNQPIERREDCARDNWNDSISNLELVPRAGDGSVSREFLVCSGFAHIGYVQLDIEPEDGSDTIGSGLAIVAGKDENQCLKGLLIVPIEGAGAGTQAYRRVGAFLVSGRVNGDPDAPFCDVEWMSMSTRVITVI